jgi:primosomal protein N'
MIFIPCTPIVKPLEWTTDRKLLIKDLVLAGPAPAPLVRAETYYRYQIMLRAQRMSALSQRLALLIRSLKLPEDVTLAVDIDPVDLA